MSIEEWWGRAFERRGSITRDALPNPPSLGAVARLSTEDLLWLIRNEPDSTQGFLSEIEFHRRENWTARAALGLSLVAVLISFVAVVLKRC